MNDFLARLAQFARDVCDELARDFPSSMLRPSKGFRR